MNEPTTPAYAAAPISNAARISSLRRPPAGAGSARPATEPACPASPGTPLARPTAARRPSLARLPGQPGRHDEHQHAVHGLAGDGGEERDREQYPDDRLTEPGKDADRAFSSRPGRRLRRRPSTPCRPGRNDRLGAPAAADSPVGVGASIRVCRAAHSHKLAPPRLAGKAWPVPVPPRGARVAGRIVTQN